LTRDRVGGGEVTGEWSGQGADRSGGRWSGDSFIGFNSG